MTTLEVLAERIEVLQARARSNHDGISKLREGEGKQNERFVKLESGVEEIKNDIGELKDQMKWVIRGLVAATVSFTGLIITIVVSAANHG